MGMKLFDDDDDGNDDVSKIVIDEAFARRYEHNKKREDLQRYEALKKEGQIEDSDSESDSESLESEDDESEINRLSRKKGFKDLINNLIKVKERDPSIYQKDVELFESDSDSDSDGYDSNENEIKGRNKKKKAVYLKDVRAQQLIEEGPEFEEEDDVGELNNAKKKKNKTKSYHQEQEDIKKEFLDAVKNEEMDGDFFRVKEKKNGNDEEEDDEYEKNLRKYFGAEEELDENNKFLKEFFEKQLWVDKENTGNVNDVEDDEVDDLLKDDEELERQEKYEEGYNFRHEENVGDRVMGHSRIVDGSVRKKENARKEQRKRKKKRMEAAEIERKEEVKRLKNLKKKEMNERLMKVMQAAGVSAENCFALDLDDLRKDFDPEDYDKMMKKAFSEEYYNTDDIDAEFGSDCEKPDFDKEDELLGLPKGWDGVDSEGFLAFRERIFKQKTENGIGEGGGGGGEEEEGGGGGGVDEEEEEGRGVDEEEEEEQERDKESKRKRKRKKSLVQKVKEEWLEEYHKLDYEGTVGDLKTRFKYAKVKPDNYGLNAEEILMLDDQELNQYVSVKKLVPYRESEWKVNKYKKHQFKERLRELRKHQKNSKKNKLKDGSDKSTSVEGSRLVGKDEPEGSNAEIGNLSRKTKRKRKLAEYKLPKSRMAAYQNIQTKAKRKGKH